MTNKKNKNNNNTQHTKRRTTHSPSAQSVVQLMGAREVNGPSIPPEVNNRISVMYRFAYSPANGFAGFTPADILGKVPGNAIGALPPKPFWNYMRLQKISMYAPMIDKLGNDPSVSIQFTAEPKIFQRTGAQGIATAALHVSPPLQTMQTWYPGTDATTQLAVVTGSSNFLCHITIEMLGNG